MIKSDALLGRTIGGYKLTKLLRNGNSGALFLAQQENSDRQIAVKLLPVPETLASSSSPWPTPFLQKMEKLVKLQHPHLLQIYDYGEYNGLGYVAMPYISGDSLRDRVQGRGQMDSTQILSFVDQLAKVVDFAHEHSVIHGRIHIGQVLLQTPDTAVLTDFGWEPFSKQGVELDIHGLGMILYEMVTGYPVEDPPIPPHVFSSTISEDLEQVLLSAIDFPPQYTQAQEIADAYSIALMETLHQRSSAYRDSHQMRAVKPSLQQPSQAAGVALQIQEGNIHSSTPQESVAFEPSTAGSSERDTMSPPATSMPQESFAASASLVSNPFLVVPLVFIVLTVILLSAIGLLSLRSTNTNFPPPTMVSKANRVGDASILVADSLAQNTQQWPITTDAFFLHSTYHLLNHTKNPLAVILTSHPFNTPISYSVTLQEIREETSKSISDQNAFGLILCYQEQNKQQTFYSFEVLNKKNGEYRFWKYDSQGQGVESSAWTLLWHQPFDGEFHYGLHTTNTITAIANGKTFVFMVNGTQVGVTPQYSSANGAIGLSVTRMGTEVAFSHLLVKQVKG